MPPYCIVSAPATGVVMDLAQAEVGGLHPGRELTWRPPSMFREPQPVGNDWEGSRPPQRLSLRGARIAGV